MSFCLLIGRRHLKGDVGRGLGAHGLGLLLELLAAGLDGNANANLGLLLFRG
jgi:hypothetical protein